MHQRHAKISFSEPSFVPKMNAIFAFKQDDFTHFLPSLVCGFNRLLISRRRIAKQPQTKKWGIMSRSTQIRKSGQKYSWLHKIEKKKLIEKRTNAERTNEWANKRYERSERRKNGRAHEQAEFEIKRKLKFAKRKISNYKEENSKTESHR